MFLASLGCFPPFSKDFRGSAKRKTLACFGGSLAFSKKARVGGSGWTTGAPDNGNDWRKFRVVPRSHPLRPLVFVFCLIGVETEGLLDYRGSFPLYGGILVSRVELSVQEKRIRRFQFP